MVQFKLLHRGLVRKVTFKNVDQPSWHELAWKFGDVCNIPHAAVALTYLDPDGDKITICSHAELKEYYSSLDEEELEANLPHKFIVRNLIEGVPDDDASDPREDNFLMRDTQMAASAAATVGGSSQWGFDPEDEVERDPTKLRRSGYRTFADALSPLAGSKDNFFMRDTQMAASTAATIGSSSNWDAPTSNARPMATAGASGSQRAQFKLIHRGLVRKVTFKNVDQPSWHELAWKIGDVCNIPHAAVALTYLDPDGDKITIASQPELKEYYSSLDKEELEANLPHKFIVRNLNEGVPDDAVREPREDNFLIRDTQTMAATTVGGSSQWGFNPEDEAERDPTKLKLSGYSTFSDALRPLAGSTVGAEDYAETEVDNLPGGFKAPPSPQPPRPAKSSGWGRPMFGVWGTSKGSGNAQASTSRLANPAPKPATNTNPWDNDQNVTKTPAWAAATAPTSVKVPLIPWAPPSSFATGALKGNLGRPAATPASTNLSASTGPGGTVRPSGIVPAPRPFAPIVPMDSMMADRAAEYAPSFAFNALPKKKKKKKLTQAERAEEEAVKRAAEEARVEEMKLQAMQREAMRKREGNACASAEAAARAAVEDQRRMEEREWDRERERLKAEEDQRRREREQPAYQAHQRGPSDMSYSDEWQHVNNQSPEQEDEEAYRARIEAARANVFGTFPTGPQPAPLAARSAIKEQRRLEEREREREQIKAAAEEESKREHAQTAHRHKDPSISYSDEWQHIRDFPEEDEQAYRARIEAARANVFDVPNLPNSNHLSRGTSQPPPMPAGSHRSDSGRDHSPQSKQAHPNSHQRISAWAHAQKEARQAIKAEQDRLDRLLAIESENLRHAEEALAQHRARCSADDPEYHIRLLAEEELHVRRERERVAKLRADNALQLTNLIKREMDRIHAAMMEDKLRGLLTSQESELIEHNIPTDKEEERRASAAHGALEKSNQLGEKMRKTVEELDEGQALAAWMRYESAWQDLLNNRNAHGRQLTFYDIPWPVAISVRSFDELGSSAIEKFLLSPHHSKTKTRKMRLRAALGRWNPDEFSQRFLDRMEEPHQKAILAGVRHVKRALTKLMNASE